MTDILFDSSTLISIATNNLLWVLPKLKTKTNSKFYITSAVKKEVINVPLRSKRFKLEAVQLLTLISEGVIEVFDSKAHRLKTMGYLDMANGIFNCKGNVIKIVQKGEMDSLVTAKEINAVLAMDERTTRLLVENPQKLHQIMEKKFHCTVPMEKRKLNEFHGKFRDVKIIRSTELMLRAYELGILDRYVDISQEIMNINVKEEFLDGLLWGLRLRCCSISSQEIDELVHLELSGN